MKATASAPHVFLTDASAPVDQQAQDLQLLI